MKFLETLEKELNAKFVLQKMKEWEVDLDDFVGSIEKLERTGLTDRAEQLRKMAEVQGLMNDSYDISASKVKAFFKTLDDTSRIHDMRWGRWSKQVTKVLEWAGSISATAIAYDTAEEAIDRYYKELSQHLGGVGSLTDTSRATWRAALGIDWAKANAVASAYGQSVEELYSAAMYKSSVEGEAMSLESMTRLAAMGRTFKNRTGDIWEYIVKRQREFNESQEESLRQMDRVLEEFESANDYVRLLGDDPKYRLFRSEFFDIVHKAADSSSGMPKNAAIIATVVSEAYKKYVTKGSESKGDTEAVLGSISKLLQNDPWMAKNLGERLVERVKAAALKEVGTNATADEIAKAQAKALTDILGPTIGLQAQQMFDLVYARGAANPTFLHALGNLYKEVPEGAAYGLQVMRDTITGGGNWDMLNAVGFFRKQGLSELQAVQAAKLLATDDFENTINKLHSLDKTGMPKIPTEKTTSDLVDSAARDPLGLLTGVWAAIKSSPITRVAGALLAAGVALKLHMMQRNAMLTRIAAVTSNVKMATLNMTLAQMQQVGTRQPGWGIKAPSKIQPGKLLTPISVAQTALSPEPALKNLFVNGIKSELAQRTVTRLKSIGKIGIAASVTSAAAYGAYRAVTSDTPEVSKSVVPEPSQPEQVRVHQIPRNAPPKTNEKEPRRTTKVTYTPKDFPSSQPTPTPFQSTKSPSVQASMPVPNSQAIAAKVVKEFNSRLDEKKNKGKEELTENVHRIIDESGKEVIKSLTKQPKKPKTKPAQTKTLKQTAEAKQKADKFSKPLHTPSVSIRVQGAVQSMIKADQMSGKK